MVRKTVTLPESTVEVVRDRQLDGESFSAAVARLIEEGARPAAQGETPSWVGTAEGPGDLSQRVEEILRELALKR